ncbi:MAG: SusC/RagA family TonB-linked outer membrane protein [Candidatus Pseudobacter hemicellulosilyticus]|uniref:SusC/RagA family TonB-linked outer membrane protein n=1 Tax=Candidatus Pseudobacter hemicellulosilyticus TaxID=3121375 RepID=A0AAJ5WN44_9BACT|nr:MAG: SusC/RagA family TonB-linked outer membrane protein [Pseudobacter sp.]
MEFMALSIRGRMPANAALRADWRNRRSGLRWLTKTLLVMKLTFILLTAAFLQVQASGFAQKVSVEGKDLTLRKIFNLVEKQTGYVFFFNREDLLNARPVSVKADGMQLEDFLTLVLKDQQLDFRIEDRTIMLSRRPLELPEARRKDFLTLYNALPISGTVTASGGQPLLGATIRIKGKAAITLTDEKGQFSLQADPGDILLVSYVGYTTQEHTVRNADPVRIVMIPLQQNLDTTEVVLSTGYQQLPRERATGSFAQPDKQMFEARVSTDLVSRLEGITSGYVYHRGGDLATNESPLKIRGRSTIFANTEPLIVVDNFPYDGDITNINPNDIETINILKDAAAASIWGARAGNGVIVITTKKGRVNRPLRVSLNSNVTVSAKPDLKYTPQYLPSSDLIDLETYLFNQGYYDNQFTNPNYPVVTPVVELLQQQRLGQIEADELKTRLDALRSIDVRDEIGQYFYRPAVNQQYALSLNGGGERNTYYLSVGYDKNLSTQKGSDYDRVTINLDNMFRPVKNLTLTGGLQYARTNQEGNQALANTAFYGSFLYPYAQLKDAAGNNLPINKELSNAYLSTVEEKGFLNWQYYPLDELNGGYDLSHTAVSDLRLNGSATYELIRGLKASVRYQFQQYNSEGSSLHSVESYFSRRLINMFSQVDASGRVTGYNIPMGGILSRSSEVSHSNNIRGELSYDGSWKNHDLVVLAGIEQRELVRSSEGSMFYGYDDATATYSTVVTGVGFNTNPNSGGFISDGLSVGGQTDRFRSYYGNAAYTYAGRYTLSLSGRIDQSNYFGVKSNQRSVPLWSAGAKWDIHKESFYRAGWLPELSFRTSYGFNGNLDRNLAAVTTLMVLSGGMFGTLIDGVPFAIISNIGNPELRWEKVGMLNLGIDFALKDRLLSGTVELFFKKGMDLIGDQQLAPTAGVTNLRGNYAGIKGKGIDLTLNTKSFGRRLRWNASLLASWAAEKISSYSAPVTYFSSLVDNGSSIHTYVGKPVSGIFSYKWAGLDPANGDPQGYDAEGHLSKDYFGLTFPMSIDEIVYSGPGRPVVYGGLRNTISYKQLSLSFNISYKLGYYFRRGTVNYPMMISSYQMHEDYLDRWQQPGDELKTTVPSFQYPVNSMREFFYGNSEATVEKGDHIRLQDISLSYTAANFRLLKLPMQSFQFYVYANNIGLLWKATSSRLDPDYPTGGFPAPRTIAAGIKASF